jgi:hypothetical protein
MLSYLFNGGTTGNSISNISKQCTKIDLINKNAISNSFDIKTVVNSIDDNNNITRDP